MDEATLPKIISVDDHVVEPAHLWSTWLPHKFRDRGPRVERRGVRSITFAGAVAYTEVFDDESPHKADTWVFEDLVYTHKRMVAAVGYRRDEMTMTPITYDEMRPGCYDPTARLADMDLNWVEASACYPTFPRFCGQTFAEGKDKDLGLACVQAYNDWTVDEWCGDSGGRLIPICLIPLWDARLAAAEVRRNAARGVRAVAFSEIPVHLGLPSIHSGHWDPFFAACEETGTAVQAELALAQTLFAAVAHDEHRDDADFHAVSAQLVASEAAVHGAAATVQILGGMGFTFEHDAQLFVKRAHVLTQLFGGRAQLLRCLLALPSAQ